MYLKNKMFQFKRKKYRQYSDEKLISLYKEEQDSLCIGLLYERYSHLVMGVALKYTKNSTDAEEITSKIFEELANKLKKHTIDFFKPWLYRVTMNESFQLLRKKGREISVDEYPNLVVEDADNEVSLKEQKIELVESALQNLKPEQKQCIDLFYLQEKSYQQISEELNLPLMKVKSYIQNGKRNLKIQLEELNEFKNEK